MSDPTTVYLIVPVEHAATVEEMYSYFDESTSYSPGYHMFRFLEINYGNLEHLDKLQALGIAYESSWESGDEYAPGTEYCRFTPEGECVISTVYNEDVNPGLLTLMDLLDKPEELIQYIKDHHARVTPIPRENQVEYGKIYAALQLIQKP